MSRRLQDEIRSSGALPLDVIADALPALVAYVDAEARYRFSNKAYEQWFGLAREQVRGRHLPEIIGDAAYEVLRPHVEAALAGLPVVFEAEVPYERGGTRHVRASYIPHRDASGRVQGFVSLTSDVTEERRAQEALKCAHRELEDRVVQRTAELSRAKAFLEALERATVTGIFVVDPQGRQTYVNPAFAGMLGFSAADLAGATPPFAYWPPEEGPAIARVMERMLAGQVPPDGFELRFMRRDGERFLVHLLVAPLREAEGGPGGWVASVHDVTERRRAEETLRKSEVLLAEAQSLAHVGSWEWDMAMSRLSWSDELFRIYGLEPGAFAPTFEGFLEKVHPEDREATRAAVDAACRTGQPFAFEEKIVRPDGAVRILWTQGRAVLDDDGRVVRLLGSCQDVTEGKRAEEERAQLFREQAARTEAEKTNRLKDEFLATLSHELRTPLNAIVGWAHLLKSGGLDESMTMKAVETISRNAMIQNQLISDILDIQRIASGKLRLELHPTEPAMVLEAALDTVRPVAAAKDVRLEAALDPGAVTVVADAGRLQQVVWNLLSNAVKFSPSRGRVWVRLARVDGSIEISVEDEGPGIDPQFLPYIFERFRQGDSSSTRRQGGLGLGLAIVRSLVDLHGGTVTAGNRPGGGAVFRVRIPVAVTGTSPAVRGQVTSRGAGIDEDVWLDSAPRLHGARVLVVDDEPDAREVVAMVLEQCGADVIVASSSAEGLIALQRDRPDVLLSDIEMPGEDGYAFLRKVRALPVERGGLTPAAALTAYAGTEDRIRALNAGFQMHVPKPVQPAELATVVSSLRGRFLN